MRRTFFVCTLILALFVLALGAEFNGSFSLTAGSAVKLTDLLLANGYSNTGGGMQLDYLQICNPSTNGVNIVFGQANVTTTNGFALTPGQCNTWPAGSRATDAASIYLRTTVTEPVMVSLRSR